MSAHQNSFSTRKRNSHKGLKVLSLSQKSIILPMPRRKAAPSASTKPTFRTILNETFKEILKQGSVSPRGSPPSTETTLKFSKSTSSNKRSHKDCRRMRRNLPSFIGGSKVAFRSPPASAAPSPPTKLRTRGGRRAEAKKSDTLMSPLTSPEPSMTKRLMSPEPLMSKTLMSPEPLMSKTSMSPEPLMSKTSMSPETCVPYRPNDFASAFTPVKPRHKTAVREGPPSPESAFSTPTRPN